MNLAEIKLAIVGLGYVGLLLAVEFGKTRDVIGFDINKNRISIRVRKRRNTQRCLLKV